MCKCNKIGVATKGGNRILRQTCVAQRLNAANATSIAMSGKPTEYLPEVAYDMSPTPPAPPVPIMSEDSPLVPHNVLPEWIRERWPGGMRGYRAGKKAGLDQIRRPDVVIVNDPSQPPVQSNIRAVVEMKFDDEFGRGQEYSYRRIAGNSSKFVPLRRSKCGCRDEEPEARPVQSTQAESELDEFFSKSAKGMNRASPAGLPPPPPGIVFP